NFIVPKLLGSQVELHPLMVLFAILIGASLMGLPGALIAVPITTAGMYLAEEFYLRPLQARESLSNSQ
ncbi:MAG: AI-2E family transporter, partial [Candidatus Obscuribacterales bacterium]|nr:AI-2E family transporter [Candidatus Obscuribacterales bacterium]